MKQQNACLHALPSKRLSRFGRIVLSWCCLMLASSAIAQTATTTPIAPEAEPIRIGVPVSLTGRLADFADQQLKGMEQFVDDINNRGALLGRPVRLVTLDDGSTEAGAQSAYQRLRDQGIDLFVSPYSSELTLAIQPEVQNADVVMMSLASAPQIWKEGGSQAPKIFGLYTPADENMLPLLKLAQEKGLTRLGLVYQQTDFPEAVAAAVRLQAPQMGLQLVFDEGYGANAPNLAALADRLGNTNPEVVVVGSYIEDAIAFTNAATNLKPKLIAFSGGPALRDYGDKVGHGKANGVLSTAQWMRSVRYPGSFDFGFRYRDRHGIYPSYDAAGGYAALQVLEAAVRLAGSTEPQAVREQLSNMKFRSIVGHYRVDARGRQTAKSTYLVQWQNSHISLVYPTELSRFELMYPFPGW